MNIKVTKAQLKAIIEMANDISSMIGCSEKVNGFNQDDVWTKQIKHIDKMLDNNGYKRKYN